MSVKDQAGAVTIIDVECEAVVDLMLVENGRDRRRETHNWLLIFQQTSEERRKLVS